MVVRTFFLPDIIGVVDGGMDDTVHGDVRNGLDSGVCSSVNRCGAGIPFKGECGTFCSGFGHSSRGRSGSVTVVGPRATKA